MADKRQPTQKTRPRKRGAKPIEVPVPERKDVLDTFRKASRPDSPARGAGK